MIGVYVCDAKDRNHYGMEVIGVLRCEKEWLKHDYIDIVVPEKPWAVMGKCEEREGAFPVLPKRTRLEVVRLKSADMALLCDFSEMTEEEKQLHLKFFSR